MWADNLLLAEQHHLLRLFIWSEASIVLGGGMVAFLVWRRIESPMLRHFAIQTAAWGAVILALAFVGWKRLALRDHAAAVSLDRFVWLNIGLDIGYVAVGVTLILVGWFGVVRRPGLAGAGAGVVLQGMALAWLDYLFAQQILR
ncbi:MAG: hypothetical protein H0X64_13030 [Gemmatimonadaceae bacterium]|nr:hypothetical protein [Gemmatimonadaceae bacterium]